MIGARARWCFENVPVGGSEPATKCSRFVTVGLPDCRIEINRFRDTQGPVKVLAFVLVCNDNLPPSVVRGVAQRKGAEVAMRDAIRVSSWIKGGVIVVVTLAIVALTSKGRLTAQGGLSGTWSGPSLAVLCSANDSPRCSNHPGTASITISDTPYGFTGQTMDMNQIDGYYVNQTGDPVLVLRVVALTGACAGFVQTGSAVLNMATNTLNASSAGINPDCRAQTASFTLVKQ